MRAHGGIASPLLRDLYTLAAQAQGCGGEAKHRRSRRLPMKCWTGGGAGGVGPFTVEQKKMMLDG